MLFILEDTIYVNKIRGYQIIAHKPEAKDVSDSIIWINDDELYYICHDSKNELLDQIKKRSSEKGCTNLTHFTMRKDIIKIK